MTLGTLLEKAVKRYGNEEAAKKAKIQLIAKSRNPEKQGSETSDLQSSTCAVDRKHDEYIIYLLFDRTCSFD